jgi:hypothetical protein
MARLTRILELLTGRPHQHRYADEVRVAARELRHTAKNLNMILGPYSKSEDPLRSLMTAILRARRERKHRPREGEDDRNADG